MITDIKRNIAVLISLLTIVMSSEMNAQSRWYVSAGVSDVWISGSMNTWVDKKFFSFNHHIVDVEYDRKVLGSFHVVTGLSVFTAGYSGDSYIFGSASEFKATFLSIPVMARLNPGNKNAFYIDFGITPFYLLKGRLTESIYRFGDLYVVEGDVQKYSNRFYFGTKFQMVIPVNRVHFALYIQLPFSGQNSTRGLEDHWGLNRQQSTYMLAGGFTDYMILGLKLGYRVR